ncbi:ATPase [Xaviernesmea oryzae]|uniref:ATPase n=1 Tax=Xaviernesmea oryzae TaxID=464029 RepID=A0A1Q9AVR4_9HYPH|nr:AAA family ATPase [Xaviernesmea oryzae]OLP59529.1 ATPase [Xaviernesmea oryzae]SEM14300.1 Predicted ATPase [Xaviernesmea oryzae]
MKLRSLQAQGYRSLRAIDLDLSQVNLFVGENGVGKSNLYRALQLLQAAATGRLAEEIAAEGGMGSALWSGQRRKTEPARIILSAELLDDERAVTFRYRAEAGLRPPQAAVGFALEPQIKEEELSVETGHTPVAMMRRKGPAVFVRDESGRMVDYPERAMTSETALAMLGDAGHYPEIGTVRSLLERWRFFHGFRTDRDSPLRRPCLAITAPLLAEDGANLAAVFATLSVTREDTAELDAAVSDALGGARLMIPEPGETASFGLVLPEFPRRVFQPRELSDGQIRFLALAGALLSYRRPPLIALNEPEASLHPDMLAPLARLVAEASRDSQIWVVTHSEKLATEIAARASAQRWTVTREEGETRLVAGIASRNTRHS